MSDQNTKEQLNGMKGIVFISALLIFSLFPYLEANASKVQTFIKANFTTSTELSQIGGQIDLVLHVTASRDTNQVNVRFHIPPQLQAFVGGSPWSGVIVAGQTIDLPISVIIQQAGEFTLEALVEAPDFNQFTTTRMNIIASNQGVQISDSPLLNMQLNQMTAPQQQQHLNSSIIANESPAVPSPLPSPSEQLLDQYMMQQLQQRNPEQQGGLLVTPENFPLAAVATTVSGTLNYKDDAAVQHPIRYAKVKILDGTSNAVLMETMTLSNGSYSAVVTAASVKVHVLSEDGVSNLIAKVHPLGQAAVRYGFISTVTPVTSAATTVSFTLSTPVRGPPNALANDAIGARAFIVLDALTQYQVQAFGLRGSIMPQVDAVFPNGAGSPCPTISCYSSSKIYILREDALDWDVIGHEFFHYVTDIGANRPIDNSPGGAHNGASQIGQNACPTAPVPPSNVWTTHVCSRDEGMKLAWSEGLATYMAVSLQNEPASTAFGLTWPNFPGVGNTNYQDTEDAGINTNLESTTPDGYGSEDSVAAMLWDLTDTPADSASPAGAGQASDRLDMTPKNIWDWINTTLPCPICDRVDRFWSALFTSGISNMPALLDKAEAVAMNNIAPELTAPAEGTTLPCLSPTFTWVANGDPSPSHNPNQFFLLTSNDGFASDLQLFPRSGQPIAATQYQIPDADWATLRSGVAAGTVFTWVVLGLHAADADIMIPESGFWVSNRRTFDTGSNSSVVMVDFGITNGLSVGTAVTNQFQSMGMIFAGATGGPAYIRSDQANTASPSLSGSQNSYNGPVSINFVDATTGDSCPVSAAGSLSAGFFDSVGSNKIQAFDNTGNLLETILNQQTGVIQLFILRTQPDIAKVVFSGEGTSLNGFTIDQVGYIK